MNKKRLYLILATLLIIVSTAVFTLYQISNPPTSTVTIEYMVKEGDTCKRIAFEHNVTVESIVELNALTPECMITVKQQLFLAVPAP